MSVYDTQDIALWEARNKMSCFYCKHYAGLEKYCMRAVYITNGSESINCDEYEYNGEVKSDKER